jgi:hypothetical protein
MSLASLNDKFGLGVDLVAIVGIWAGIAAVFVAPALALTLVGAFGALGGIAGAAQVAIIANDRAA